MAQPVKYPPNTILLSPPAIIVNNYEANEAITPGHLIEFVNVSGTAKWRKHATSAGRGAAAFAKEQDMLNKGVTDAYASPDLVEAFIAGAGAKVWALIPVGANIAAGGQLSSNGDGTLKAWAAGDHLIAVADEAVNNSAGSSAARIRVTIV